LGNPGILNVTGIEFAHPTGVSDYSPPEGSVLIIGGHIGVMQAQGLHIALEASSEDLLLAAARALEPVPS
jgi:hypothetical protein